MNAHTETGAVSREISHLIGKVVKVNDAARRGFRTLSANQVSIPEGDAQPGASRHLGTLSVSGRRRVPIPAASTMARIFSVIPICNLHRALPTDRSINGLKHSVCLQAVAPAAKGLAPLLNGRDKLQPFVIPGNIRAVKYQSFLLPATEIFGIARRVNGPGRLPILRVSTP